MSRIWGLRQTGQGKNWGSLESWMASSSSMRYVVEAVGSSTSWPSTAAAPARAGSAAERACAHREGARATTKRKRARGLEPHLAAAPCRRRRGAPCRAPPGHRRPAEPAAAAAGTQGPPRARRRCRPAAAPPGRGTPCSAPPGSPSRSGARTSAPRGCAACRGTRGTGTPQAAAAARPPPPRRHHHCRHHAPTAPPLPPPARRAPGAAGRGAAAWPGGRGPAPRPAWPGWPGVGR